MNRLCAQTLEHLQTGVRSFDYRRDQACGVVHLGVGAFHRAHQAAYFDALLGAGETGWMIRGASLRSRRAGDQLNPQDGLYTLVERDGESERTRLVRSISDVLTISEDREALIDALTAADTVLVTLTITENGYCIDPTTQELDWENEDIQWDIEHPDAPRSAPGVILAGLRRRWQDGLTPFTVLSCDNLSENGKQAQAAILGLARKTDPVLAQWIEGQVAFPSSMVDRIAPATTASDIDALEAILGLRDEAMVKTEPFSQWVIEDKFCNTRPPLEKVGVQFTSDVLEWERAKLRLLNGAHSAIAYLGGLGRVDYVHQAIARPEVSALVQRIWDESRSTLRPLEGLNVDAYVQELMQRFSNSSLEHRTRQIAIDGSRKIPQRWLEPLRVRRACGEASPALLFALAAWIMWQSGVDDENQAYQVEDPLAEQTKRVFESARSCPETLAQEMLAFEPVFGSDFANDKELQSQIARFLRDIQDRGVLDAVHLNFINLASNCRGQSVVGP